MYVELLKAMFIALKKTSLLRSALVKPTHITVFSVILPCSVVHEDLYFEENCRQLVPSQCRYPSTRLHGITTNTTTFCAIKPRQQGYQRIHTSTLKLIYVHKKL